MKVIRYIDPLKDLGGSLLSVEKPARYTGGEYGCRAKKDALLQTCIAFPDLYEIGMSNNAMRILYNNINDVDNISCDRVFAPAPDFEILLKEKKIPLYGLETGIALTNFDILMFSLGYELGITGVLSILESGGIPILAKNRNDDHPIIIMGGPCVSNPVPYSEFIDAFWIGEAEQEYFLLLTMLRDMKSDSMKKNDLYSKLIRHESIWTQGKEKALRNIYRDFSEHLSTTTIFPVQSMRIVQDHGVVEIMRGCPNGCRFCHAGIWYRPMRQKQASIIQSEIDACVNKGGFKEISLSSLSSGDYCYIEELLDSINEKYSNKRISFQLPSLHISTFSLRILKKISEVRKGGLTFAMETPLKSWQFAINKEITTDSIVAILLEAKKNGWKNAKFYFMIGLPVEETEQNQQNQSEERAIVSFIEEVSRRTKLKFSVNVGVFIPKPHTPFQWSAQLNEDTARKKLFFIHEMLKKQGHKVSVHDPFTSLIEGLIARGDERVGHLIEEAYIAGCRLDAWSEFFKKDIWRRIIDGKESLVKEICEAKELSKPLVWDMIYSGTSKPYLESEENKSKNKILSNQCQQKCNKNCGICFDSNEIVQNSIHSDNNTSIDTVGESVVSMETDKIKDPDTYRILFSFSKKGRAVFLSHLSLIEVFSMATLRASIPVLYTRGFNPLPRLDFAAPLSIGISAENEICSMDMELPFEAAVFMQDMNKNLPEGISIVRAEAFLIPSGIKKRSVASLLCGFQYASGSEHPDYVHKKEEKAYRLSKTGTDGFVYGLNRLSALAKLPEHGLDRVSYFDVYHALYQTM